MEVVKDFDNFYGLARRLRTVLEFGVFWNFEFFSTLSKILLCRFDSRVKVFRRY